MMLLSLMHVIVALECQKFRVFLFLLDAGEVNKGLYNFFIEKNLPRYGWITKEFVSFQTPYDVNRLFEICFCATHGLKAIWNGIFNSTGFSNSTRYHLAVDDVNLN